VKGRVGKVDEEIQVQWNVVEVTMEVKVTDFSVRN
jgi:hypothetical protein